MHQKYLIVNFEKSIFKLIKVIRLLNKKEKKYPRNKQTLFAVVKT